MRCLLLSRLLFVPFAISSCVGSSGRAWVREAGDANLGGEVDDSELAPALARTTAELQPVTSLEASQRSRPRLAHTVSLGESESGSARSLVPVGSPPAPGVVVNIVNYGTTPYAGGYGYPLTYRTTAATGTAAPVVHSPPPSSATPPLGGDWRAAPSYGPSFPWHTGPASAWERRR